MATGLQGLAEEPAPGLTLDVPEEGLPQVVIRPVAGWPEREIQGQWFRGSGGTFRVMEASFSGWVLRMGSHDPGHRGVLLGCRAPAGPLIMPLLVGSCPGLHKKGMTHHRVRQWTIVVQFPKLPPV